MCVGRNTEKFNICNANDNGTCVFTSDKNGFTFCQVKIFLLIV